MEEKIRLAVFGQKRLSREGGIKSKTVLRLRQKTSAFPFLPTRAFDGWNSGVAGSKWSGGRKRPSV